MTSKQITVLVADDRPANRYTTIHALKRAGFGVIEADTGKEALELSKQLPTVIVLDVKLPDIVGYEVCRRIKANAQTGHIPVLQLSAAFVSNESKLYAVESGADAYLIQPADPIVLVATVKSLARLHRAESQARIAAKQWQATFDALNEGVAMADSSGIVQRCNRSMTEIFGKSYGEIENCPIVDLLRDRFAFTLAPHDVNTTREVRFENRFFRFSLDPVSAQGDLTGSIFIVAETTKEKLAEEALLISERLAATGRIAHTIAHEINNPLEAITNLVYLMQHSLDQPQIAEQYINSAASELERVSRISRQILSFNRDSSSPVEIRIDEIIDDVLALNNRAIANKNLLVEKDSACSLLIHGFPAQLRQVFSNLIRNAVEASRSNGKIRIKISSSRLGMDFAEPAIRVTIADYGMGIPAENIKRIFEAFFTIRTSKDPVWAFG